MKIVIIEGAGPQEIRLRAGQHRLLGDQGTARRSGDKLVTINRGGKEIVEIGFERGHESVTDTASSTPNASCMRCHQTPQDAALTSSATASTTSARRPTGACPILLA